MGETRSATSIVLRGHGAQLSYATNDGGATLDFHDHRHQLHFTDAEIQKEPSALGTLATVAIEAVPDRDTTTLTLLVPDARLGEGESQVPVSTFAMITVARTSIGGPELVSGQLRTYTVLPLSGTAFAAAPHTDASWQAGYVAQTDNSLRLVVEGRLSLPTPGYSVSLQRRAPQGINPTDLLLDLVIVAPTGIEPQHVVEDAVDFEEPSDGHFRTVSIVPGGPTLDIRPAR
jgi:hypothetical protein